MQNWTWLCSLKINKEEEAKLFFKFTGCYEDCDAYLALYGKDDEKTKKRRWITINDNIKPTKRSILDTVYELQILNNIAIIC